MTRVTEAMFFASLTRGVSDNQARLYEAQQKAQSGMRVSKMSDDPVAGARALVLNTGLRRLDAMERSAKRAKLELMGSESSLANAEGILVQAKELAIAGADGKMTANDRTILAEEVEALRQSLLGIANQEAGGVHLFAGFLTDTPPFLADGSYAGDNGARQVEVAPGVSVTTNVSGADAFGAGGGTDIFGLLGQLRDDLAANDQAGVQNRLNDLEAGREQIANSRADIGVELGRLDDAQAMRDDATDVLTEGHADAVEADTVATYADLLAAQAAFQAAIAQATRILSSMAQGPGLG